MHKRYPPHPDNQSGAYQVLRTGQSQFVADITAEMLEASITDREQLTLARKLGLRSAMVVPIVARGRTLGAMTLVWAESGRRYSRDDLAGEEIGRRAGIALDNAQAL